ncbi:MAG: aldehyde ferredoxin oxidoreductase, partial [Nitrospirota bacterium]
SQCLSSVGYQSLADNIDSVSSNIQKLRWKTRIETGFNPKKVSIPKRFTEITTWKGNIDQDFLKSLQQEYAQWISEFWKED